MIAIAIDDEPPALKIIEMFSANSGLLDLKKTFTNPAEALRYIKKFPVDLLFIDIQMPGYNGMEFFKELENKPMAIFTTAFSEYAVEGFNVSAIDYLMKPFTQERFTQAVKKAVESFKSNKIPESNRSLLIRSNYSLAKILYDDIQLIESMDDYLTIYLLSGKKIVSRMTLKTMLNQLPSSEFVRVHRSYILPWKLIEQVRNKIIMIGNKKIPIGNSYEKDFFSQYTI
ncbi:MAG: response regulator transcription factor [Paludibacter sp.]